MSHAQQRILDLTEKILLDQLTDIAAKGTYQDVEDMDGKGGIRTQRLSNTTGLGEIRLIRSAALKELGLDQGTNQNPKQVPSQSPLFNLLQSKQITLEELQKLGTSDDD